MKKINLSDKTKAKLAEAFLTTFSVVASGVGIVNLVNGITFAHERAKMVISGVPQEKIYEENN